MPLMHGVQSVTADTFQVCSRRQLSRSNIVQASTMLSYDRVIAGITEHKHQILHTTSFASQRLLFFT
jgi:hypothetical protein